MRDSDRTNPAGAGLDTERWRTLRAGARRRLSHWRGIEVDVDDLIAESWLVLAQRGALDTCDAQLLERIVTIARGRAVDSMRRRSVRRGADGPELLESLCCATPSPSGSGPLRRDLLMRLAPQQRAVIFLRHGLGLEFEAIRNVLGRRSTHAVRCLHSRARRTLIELAISK